MVYQLKLRELREQHSLSQRKVWPRQSRAGAEGSGYGIGSPGQPK